MASLDAVGACLKMFARAYTGGVFDDGRVEVYAAALEDLTDEQLANATVRVIKSHERDFIPPAAVILAAARAERSAVDVGAVLNEIHRLAIYNPASGMIYPSVRAVRESLGDAVANAYADAGGTLVFSGPEDVGGQIARREFRQALNDAAVRGAPLPMLPMLGHPAPPRLRLTDGSA